MKKIALITTAAVLALTPAAAEAGKKSCPKDSLCLWTKANYKGKKAVFDQKGVHNLPAEFNNRVTSAKNKWTKGEYAYLYAGKDGEGERRCLSPGMKVPTFDTDGWFFFGDEASSFELPKGDQPGCL